MQRGPQQIKRSQNERKENSRQQNIEKDQAKVKDEERKPKRLSLQKQRKEDPKKVKQDQIKRQVKCRHVNTEQKLLKQFRECTMFNALLTCCSCQRNLFKGNVTKFIQRLQTHIETKKPGLYEHAIGLDSQKQPFKVNINGELSS